MASSAAGRVTASLVGTLPPVKGVSAYTAHLLDALAREPSAGVEFIGFRRIYPRRAYPGGDPDEAGMAAPVFDDVRVRNDITWYNPLTWIGAGFHARGDVVHAQWWSYALAPVYVTALGIARLRGKRVLLTVHNVAPHEGGLVKRALNRVVFRLAHGFVVHSEQNRRELARIIGAGARIDVLPHGALETPRTGMSRLTARARLGIAPDARVVLCFGNIRPYKGVEVLLRAFARVARDDDRAVLVIAGKPWEDWAPYARLIDELGIGHRVRCFLDYVPTPEIEPYFVAADVVALPYTHFDAQSGVGTRALPFGRPLVVTNTGGLPELVMEPEAVVPPSDADALAAALARVLGDAALRDRMAVDSLTIAGSLSWDRIALRTAEIYARIAGTPIAADVDEQQVVEATGAGRP
jgi:glycosyltransferase involved in cell wall biosynthesis